MKKNMFYTLLFNLAVLLIALPSWAEERGPLDYGWAALVDLKVTDANTSEVVYSDPEALFFVNEDLTEEASEYQKIITSLVGKKTGDQFTLKLTPDQHVGAYQDNKKGWAPRSSFPDAKVGEQFTATKKSGERVHLTILDIDESDQTVLVDENHPWAGKTVVIQAEVLNCFNPQMVQIFLSNIRKLSEIEAENQQAP